MMKQSLAICAIMMALLFDVNTAGSIVSLTSSTRTKIINQHRDARNAAWNGNTKLPAASPTKKSGYKATMSWDYGLASAAADHAASCKFGHSTYGENIYWSSNTPSQYQAKQATPNWLSELKYYSWSKIGQSWGCQSGKMCGHYTQAIWAGSTKIGCGMANCASSKVLGKYSTMVVCQYYPYGNYQGQYPYTDKWGRSDAVPFGEVSPEEPAQSMLGLNLIVFALLAMMVINVTCLIAVASKRCNTKGNGGIYQSVNTKEIEV